MSEWDAGILHLEIVNLAELQIGSDLDLDLTVMGYNTPELDLIIGGAVEEEEQPSEIVEDLACDKVAVTQIGDLWILGEHRLLCGNALEPKSYKQIMAGKHARMVFTDPPYNVPICGHVRTGDGNGHREFAMASGEMDGTAFRAFLFDFLERSFDVLQDGGIAMVCMDWRHIEELIAAGKKAGFDLINLCVWNKNNGGMGSLYRSKHELVAIFKKAGAAHVNNVELGKHGRYTHLNLPAIAEEAAEIATGLGKAHSRDVGEPLFPQRLSLENLESMRSEMGASTFNMQYQQNPTAPDGSTLRWEWFGTYDEPLPRNRYEMVVQSWDTAMSADPRADFSVCTTWGFHCKHWHLLDVFRDRLDYPDLRKKCLQLQSDWEADRVYIENAASGKPLLQDCRNENEQRFFAINPKLDKEIRFNVACAFVESGLVLLPTEAPWLAVFKRELQGFPRARFDDQVDSFSQFLNWAKGVGFRRALGREHPINREHRTRLEGQRERRR